jgi:hypothetical protein
MTHTLHRFGRGDDFDDDYIVTAMPARGFNDRDCVPKQKAFLRAALKHGPVNIGNSIKGAAHRAAKNVHPTVHWRRDDAPDPEAVIAEVDRPATVSAVFDNFGATRAFLQELKEMDLGLSVNVSGDFRRAAACARECGLTRHSVEYSLGFQGATDRLADDRTLRLAAMCGHGMVSATFAKQMLDWVRGGRRTPERACAHMARLCACGSFNPSRAERILREVLGTDGGEQG